MSVFGSKSRSTLFLGSLLTVSLSGTAVGCDGGGAHDSTHALRAKPGVVPPKKPEEFHVDPSAKAAPAPPPAVEARPRPAEDEARDADRKPQEVMDFAGIQPGMRVAELMTGRGYYAELLSRRVGDEGIVYAHNSPFVMDRFAREPLEQRLSNPVLSNIHFIESEVDRPKLPRRVDAVFLVLFFHDLYWQDVDRPRMLDNVKEALKDDGVFIVVDHRAEDGSKDRDVKNLHRVDEAMVRAEIEAAGFELVETSDLLAHPEDDRTKSAFDESIRGKTDRFVHKYRRVR